MSQSVLKSAFFFFLVFSPLAQDLSTKQKKKNMVHVDNKGIIDVLWRGETKCMGPKAKDADLWVLIWEEVRRIHQEGALPESSK